MCNHAIMARVESSIESGRRVDRRALVGGALSGAALLAEPLRRAGARRQVGSTAGRVFDLTHPLSKDFPVYPGYTPFSAMVTSTIDGIGSLSRQVTMEEHVGTHVDAPAHFIAEGDDVSQIAPERLIAPLVVLDISGRAEHAADATVQPDDILAWEDEYGDVPTGAFVAVYSGWDRRVDDPIAFLNVGNDGLLHFPAWSPEAAAFLVEERDIVGVGVDTISLDNTTSPFFESHVILLGAGCYGVENLARLAEVPPAGTTIVVGAPRFAGGSGGPARVFAIT